MHLAVVIAILLPCDNAISHYVIEAKSRFTEVNKSLRLLWLTNQIMELHLVPSTYSLKHSEILHIVRVPFYLNMMLLVHNTHLRSWPAVIVIKLVQNPQAKEKVTPNNHEEW